LVNVQSVEPLPNFAPPTFPPVPSTVKVIVEVPLADLRTNASPLVVNVHSLLPTPEATIREPVPLVVKSQLLAPDPSFIAFAVPVALDVMDTTPEPNLRLKPIPELEKAIEEVPVANLRAKPAPAVVTFQDEEPTANLLTLAAPLAVKVQFEAPLGNSVPITNSTLSAASGRSAQSVDCGNATDRVEEPIHSLI